MGVLLAGGLPGLLNQSSAQIVDGSLKFNKESEDRLTRTMSAGNQTKFTLSCWLKPTDQADYLYLMGVSSECSVYITNTRKLHADFYSPDGSSWAVLSDTQGVFRDLSAWYHVVAMLDTSAGTTNADRYKIYVNGVQQTIDFSVYWGGLITGNAKHVNENGQTFQINSRPGGSYYNSFYLSQYNYIDGQALGPESFGYTDPLTNTWRPKKFSGNYTIPASGIVYSSYGSGTVSGVKGYTRAFDGNLSLFCEPNDNSTVTFDFTSLPGGGITVGSSLRMYLNKAGTPAAGHFTVNGTNLGGSVPSGGWLTINSVSRLDTITFYHQSGSSSVELYAVEVDGSILTDGTAAQGANSFYLPMDNDDFHIDKSGNGNNYTPVNFSGTSIDPDILKDSPSGAVSGGRAQTGITTTSSAPSNYCTMNPLDTTLGSNLQDGNLKTVGNSSWSTSHARGTFKMTSGKWFWEGTKSGGGGAVGQFGFANSSANLNESYSSAPANSWTFYFGNGTEIIVPAANSGSYFAGSAMTNGDTAGVALDMDNGTWQFFKNGVGGAVKTLAATDSGSTASITELYPYVGSYNSNFDLNFGQKPFKFPPPAGYQPLNAANVKPETVIVRPDQYVGIVTYTGTGNAFNINYNFSPDFAWVKGRTFASYHQLSDTVRNRAAGGNRRLELPTTQAQDGGGPGFINSGLNINTNAAINTNDQNFVAWAWKAGGNKNTFNVDDVGYASAAAAGLTAGTITPTGSSVGTKQGFSIIQYTGTDASSNTFSHGLSQKPNFAIFKNLSQSGDDFIIYHSSLGATKRMKLNSTSTADSQTSQFNDTEPTSSVFTIGTYDNINKLNNNYISYIWHDVVGLQKFGSYVGNANTDGTFVELGFRPRWIMQKNISGQEWFIHDTARDPINVAGFRLVTDLNVAENTSKNTWLDILSNGFKLRTTNEAGNSGTFIYMAWAEAPVSNLYGGQSNAR